MGNSNKLISAIILAVLSLNLAATLGVNAPYWQGNPLKMYPGETREETHPTQNILVFVLSLITKKLNLIFF